MRKLCLIKEKVEDDPNSNMADKELTNKKKAHLFPRLTFYHFTRKLFYVNHFCTISEIHFYKDVTSNIAAKTKRLK